MNVQKSSCTVNVAQRVVAPSIGEFGMGDEGPSIIASPGGVVGS